MLKLDTNKIIKIAKRMPKAFTDKVKNMGVAEADSTKAETAQENIDEYNRQQFAKQEDASENAQANLPHAKQDSVLSPSQIEEIMQQDMVTTDETGKVTGKMTPEEIQALINSWSGPKPKDPDVPDKPQEPNPEDAAIPEQQPKPEKDQPTGNPNEQAPLEPSAPTEPAKDKLKKQANY